jgi:hypothetical protein
LVQIFESVARPKHLEHHPSQIEVQQFNGNFSSTISSKYYNAIMAKTLIVEWLPL